MGAMLNASQLGLRDFRKDREESPNKPQLLPHIQVASLVPAAAASLQTASPELAAAASEARRFRFVSDIPRALKIASCSSEDLMPLDGSGRIEWSWHFSDHFGKWRQCCHVHQTSINLNWVQDVSSALMGSTSKRHTPLVVTGSSGCKAKQSCLM